MNKIFSTLLILLATSGLHANNGKFDRIMARADSFYVHFSYIKAIKLYENALDVKDEQRPKVQLANCYWELNQPENAQVWYEKALTHGTMEEREMLRYGQILSILQRYDSAQAVLGNYTSAESWVETRADGFRNIQKFYLNEIAFEVAEADFNTEESDFSPTLKKDGTVVFVSGRPHSGILKSKYQADKSLFLNLFELDSGEVKKLQRGITSRYHEGPSQFYADDKKFVFTRNNYLNHNVELGANGVQNLKLYFSDIDNDRWSKPTEFPYNSNDFSIGHPALTADEQTLYFASDMPGGYGGVDIYKSTLVNGTWSQPENLGNGINTERDEMFPYVSVNNFLYFSSDGHQGLGALDVFRVDLERSNSKPRNLGYALNSAKDDFGIYLDMEEGNKGYFSSNREGGTGSDDIYEVRIYDHVITVNLRDALTRELIVGSMKAHDPNMDEIIRDEAGTSSIQFPALSGDSFSIYGAAPDYVSDSLAIRPLSDDREMRPLVYDLYLNKAKGATTYIVRVNDAEQQVFYQLSDTLSAFAGNHKALEAEFSKKAIRIDSTIILSNVLYDFDESAIRQDAANQLDQWVTFLNQYPEQKISLSSHTDARGSNRYNERLAKRRVKEAMKYLTNAGISEERIVERSFGEEKLWESCAEEECDELQHQNNRRTEILIEK